jgi:hypothetical protein
MGNLFYLFKNFIQECYVGIDENQDILPKGEPEFCINARYFDQRSRLDVGHRIVKQVLLRLFKICNLMEAVEAITRLCSRLKRSLVVILRGFGTKKN